MPPGMKFVPAANDALIVSYPKSGNTWVRALIAELVSPNASLGGMERIVPDIYRSRGSALRRAHRFPFGGRILKSHESFRPDYKRVIYLVRDPRAVCLSYYRYLGTVQAHFDPKKVSIESFADSFLAGEIDRFGTWSEHVQSWGCAEVASILRLSYESLKADTHDSFDRICRFLKLDASERDIERAVAACSLSSLMKKEEAEKSTWSVVKKASPTGRFFGDGGPHGYSPLEESIRNAICNKWGTLMRTLGYD